MKAEDLVKENLIKPFLESLLNSVLVLPSKSGVTITATKKEFIEKNLSNKIILFRNLFEGIIAFMKGAFSFFISLKEYNITGDLIYYGSSKINIFFL